MRAVALLCFVLKLSYSIKCARFSAVNWYELWKVEHALEDCIGSSCSIKLNDKKLYIESSCNYLSENRTSLATHYSCVTGQYYVPSRLFLFDCLCSEDYCTIPVLLKQLRNDEKVLETVFGFVENDRTDLLIRSC